MNNERDYLSQVMLATPRNFADELRKASGDTERVLRTHFGDAQFERMHNLAQNVSEKPQGNVVMLPGIMGSSLYEDTEHIWIDPWSIICGAFDELPLDDAGISVKSIQATNLLKKYYGEMQITLLNNWNVVSFPFDWRLDIQASAQGLKRQIDSIIGTDARFSIVAHSMGGLVARSYLKQFPDNWKRVDRIVMMGTPNYGSYAIPVLYNGLNEIMRIVALVDQEHYMSDLLQIVKTFVGTYQMLPFVGKVADAEGLLRPEAYGDLMPPVRRFDDARTFQKEIADTLPVERMAYVAGYGFKTVDGIADWNKLQSWDGYHQSLNGDGTVPHSLGFIDGVSNYFAEVEHSMLPADTDVIQAVQEILTTGDTATLPKQMPKIDEMHQALLQVERLTEPTIRETQAHALREIVRLEHLVHPDKVSASETRLRELLFTSYG